MKASSTKLTSKIKFPMVIRKRICWSKAILITMIVIGLCMKLRRIYYNNQVNFKAIQGPGDTSSREVFKTKYNVSYTRKPTIEILLWTTFFDWPPNVWATDAMYDSGYDCMSGCSIVVDKARLESADAVVFHLRDIPLRSPETVLPTYRSLDQAWVLYNMESLKHIYIDLTLLNGLFNWTWSYHTNADLYTPYGQVVPLSDDERQKAEETLKKTNFLVGKTRFALAMISNCGDNAGRLNLLKQLLRYIEIDFRGLCFPDKILYDRPISSYKFYIALENSYCKEYVTEKFWNAISREQVPVVAWTTSMDHIVPSKSYINIYDFENIESAAKYIIRVSKNESLYNSYFEWKKRYRYQNSHFGSFCHLCRLLQNTTISAQIYNKLDLWYKDDVCKQF